MTAKTHSKCGPIISAYLPLVERKNVPRPRLHHRAARFKQISPALGSFRCVRDSMRKRQGRGVAEQP